MFIDFDSKMKDFLSLGHREFLIDGLDGLEVANGNGTMMYESNFKH